ncbi:hypothetical protein [Ferruginibacter sp. SUN106]|uniref:hypothetical protein n=1 Tax=Ferruginibacter sp. SUN106 TaxID=2978348 RepID=UPI003D35DE78
MKHHFSFKFLYLPLAGLFFTAACGKKESNTPGNGNTPPENNVAVTVTTIAGKVNDHGNGEDGNGLNARFWNPTKMVFDNRNNMLYVADGTSIRSIDQQNNVKTYLPEHVLSAFNEIMDIDLAPGPDGGTLYFISKENDIWKIEPNGNNYTTTKIIDRVFGGNETGAVNTSDQIDGATGITTGKNGTIFFFNSFWNTMHSLTLNSLTPVTGTVNTFAGKATATRGAAAWPYKDGSGDDASFGGTVSDIASDANGNIYVADFRNDLVRMVTPAGAVSSLFQYENGIGVDYSGPVNVAQANHVTHVSASADGKAIYFTTYGRGGNYSPALRLVKPGKEVITLVGSSMNYGDGNGASAALSTIGGIAATPDGKIIYVAEPGKKVIRKITIQ